MSPRFAGRRSNVGSLSGLIGDPISSLRLSQALSKFQGAVRTVSDVAHAINQIGPAPKLHNYLAVGMVGVSKLVEMGQFNPEESDALRRLVAWEFLSYIRRVCENHPNAKMLGRGILVTEMNGQTFIFQGTTVETEAAYYLCNDEKDQASGVFQALGREIWEQNGNRVELLISGDDGRTEGEFRRWDLGTVFQSPQATSLQERISSFLASDVSRSVLLHGVPGTGKSCMARAIASTLNMPTLFIDAAQVKTLRPSTLGYCLDILHPYVVIIDDLDRIPDVSSLLSVIDRIRSKSRVLIVTANDLGAFSPAVIRAGRFDEIEKVERVRTPKDILPFTTDEVASELEAWPISFVEELRHRVEVLGRSCLESELERLRTRVERNG